MDKIERIKELINLLNKASDTYYNTDKTIMEDMEYDKLFDELKQLEKETNVVFSNSPTANVGFEVKSKLSKVTHSIPLKSLSKTKSLDELQKFIGNKEVIFMLKGDGLTTEIIFEDGFLKQGSTRGNGTIGEDITHNVKTYKSIPLQIKFKGYLKLAGESVILDKDFELINSKLSEDEQYSNSRNLVAGSVRSLDSKTCSNRKVDFRAFTLLECYDENKNIINFETVEEQFNFLKELGFQIIPHENYNIKTGNNLQDVIDILKNISKEKGIPIDGLVIKFNDIAYGLSLGETNHHPLNAIALKDQNEEYETEYITTEWQVSRTSMINPVAVFSPVNIDGADISKATLHNLDYFKSMKLGKGDMVSIIRSNQVIPKLVGNATQSNTEEIPNKCPVCGGDTEIKLLKTARVLICTNPECSAKKISQFSHFVSRDAMNIDGLSSATIEKFISKGFLKSLSDIYELEQYKKEIIKMDGFGLKSYNKLISSIESSKKCKLSNFLYALGMPNVGKGTSKDLVEFANCEDSGDDLLFLMNVPYEYLLEMPDCGEVTASSIVDYFDNDKNIELINELLKYIEFEEDKKVEVNESAKDNFFNGKKIYCTGTFANYKKNELKEILENLGAEFASGYAKSLDVLVVGSLKGSSKEAKALKDGIRVMSEMEFRNMI